MTRTSETGFYIVAAYMNYNSWQCHRENGNEVWKLEYQLKLTDKAAGELANNKLTNSWNLYFARGGEQWGELEAK